MKVILVILAIFASIPSIKCFSINSVLKRGVIIAQCRANCIDTFASRNVKFNYRESANSNCTTKANWKCNMCWDYCELLIIYPKTKKLMCNDDICFEGCKHACKFERHPSMSSNLKAMHVKLTKPSEISWNKEANNIPPGTVFGVYGQRLENTWVEIQQTADSAASVPSSYKYRRLMVIAVTKNGTLARGEIKFGFNSKTH